MYKSCREFTLFHRKSWLRVQEAGKIKEPWLITEFNGDVVGFELFQDKLFSLGDIFMLSFFYLIHKLLKPKVQAPVILLHPLGAVGKSFEPYVQVV